MNQYEIAVIYDPGLEVDLSKAEDRIKKIFQDNGGKIGKIENWGKRKLAYKIKKHDFGIYVFYNLELSPDKVKQVETTLNITDEVIRFLITRPDLKAIQKAEAEKKLKNDRLKKNPGLVDNQEVEEESEEEK